MKALKGNPTGNIGFHFIDRAKSTSTTNRKLGAPRRFLPLWVAAWCDGTPADPPPMTAAVN